MIYQALYFLSIPIRAPFFLLRELFWFYSDYNLMGRRITNTIALDKETQFIQQNQPGCARSGFFQARLGLQARAKMLKSIKRGLRLVKKRFRLCRRDLDQLNHAERVQAQLLVLNDLCEKCPKQSSDRWGCLVEDEKYWISCDEPRAIHFAAEK